MAAPYHTDLQQGNSLLHYAYCYNFEELAEYLKEKADDRKQNHAQLQNPLTNQSGHTEYRGSVYLVTISHRVVYTDTG